MDTNQRIMVSASYNRAANIIAEHITETISFADIADVVDKLARAIYEKESKFLFELSNKKAVELERKEKVDEIGLDTDE